MIKNEEKVIKTLKDNNLIENISNNQTLEIDSNKEEDFFKEYRFRNSNINFFPHKAKRDFMGSILLDEIPYLSSNLIGDGHSKGHWILLSNGSRVFVKKDNRKNQLQELLFSELCRQLNIPCAKYDIVKTDKEYIASPSFLRINEYLIDYYSLESINGVIPPDGVKRIEMDKLIEKSKKIHDTDRLLKTIFLDNLTLHYDRFPHNYKVIKLNYGYKSSPIFDSGACCDSIKKYVYHKVSNNFSTNQEDIFIKLFEQKNFIDWFIKNYNNINTEEMLEHIYKRKQISIPDCIYKDFDKTIKDGLYVAKKCILYK